MQIMNFTTITFDSAGQIHSNDDKPVVTKTYENGNVRLQAWLKYGALFRKGDKPVCITYYLNGNVREIMYGSSRSTIDSEQFMIDEPNLDIDFHRDGDLPAFESFYSDGSIKERQYYIDGISKRKNKQNPTDITYWRNGNIKRASFYAEGQFLQSIDDNPADARYYSNGNIKFLAWADDKYVHRENEPAEIWYHINGKIREKTWYIEGKKANPTGVFVSLVYECTGALIHVEYDERINPRMLYLFVVYQILLQHKQEQFLIKNIIEYITD